MARPSFVVGASGETAPTTSRPPLVTAEDRRRGALLAQGAGGDASVADLFAEGIAVARAGGDVQAWLRDQAAR